MNTPEETAASIAEALEHLVGYAKPYGFVWEFYSTLPEHCLRLRVRNRGRGTKCTYEVALFYRDMVHNFPSCDTSKELGERAVRELYEHISNQEPSQ